MMAPDIWPAIASVMSAATFVLSVLWLIERDHSTRLHERCRDLSEQRRALAGKCRQYDRDLSIARDRLSAGGRTRAARQREAERIAREEKTRALRENR